MKEGIERGQAQTDARLASVAATVEALRAEIITLVAQEIEQQRAETRGGNGPIRGLPGAVDKGATRPLHYVIALFGAGILAFAVEVISLAVRLQHLAP